MAREHQFQVASDMADPFFDQAYKGRPPWDIGRPQPAFVELANAGQIKGSVLDVGCGTGEITLEMAERGHDAWGVDISPNAIDQAKAKAKLRGLEKETTFLVGNALEVEHLNRTFDTVIDCGLFHVFSDPEREVYAQQLATILRDGGRLHILCFSDWEDASWGGPRRVSQAEIIDTFREGWRVDDIREARFVVDPRIRIKGHCWLASLVREGKVPPKRKKKSKPGQEKPTVAVKPKKLPVVQAGLAT
jgi:SAM-dependent methyltransferase